MLEAASHSYLSKPLRELAQESVYIGTSSWKYPGWCGQVYDESRYITRKTFSESKFERECLTEYAEVFPTVCVDAGYYNHPQIHSCAAFNMIEARCHSSLDDLDSTKSFKSLAPADNAINST